MLFDQHQPGHAAESEEVNLLPPPELNVSLLRSLLANLRYVFFPQRLPPLRLTSRPLNVGMLVGDILDLPWYRTILSNIGDAISPETQPPLQLESQPVEVELISDQPAWWGSLLRNLADAAAPEKQAALRLTSGPADPNMASEVLVTPRWSSLIETPNVFRPARWRESLDRPVPFDGPVPEAAPMRTTLVHLPPLDAPPVDEYEQRLMLQLQRSVRRSHMREFVWLTVIVIEVTTLIALRLLPH